MRKENFAGLTSISVCLFLFGSVWCWGLSGGILYYKMSLDSCPKNHSPLSCLINDAVFDLSSPFKLTWESLLVQSSKHAPLHWYFRQGRHPIDSSGPSVDLCLKTDSHCSEGRIFHSFSGFLLTCLFVSLCFLLELFSSCDILVSFFDTDR